MIESSRLKEVEEREKIARNFCAGEFPIIVKYASDQDYAIAKLENLARGVINLANVIRDAKVDTLVLLDKSARPAAQLFKSYWRLIFSNETIPDIRFINIGQESKEKDSIRKNLEKLYKIHSKSINGKIVLVADESVSSGNTLRRAKGLMERIFPKANRFIYTAVFERFPSWYGDVQYLGVYDLDKLPFDFRIISILEKLEPDTHISKSLSGVISRHKNLSLQEHLNGTSIEEEAGKVNAIRKELSQLARLVTRSKFSLCEGNEPQHFLDSDLDKELNSRTQTPDLASGSQRLLFLNR